MGSGTDSLLASRGQRPLEHLDIRRHPEDSGGITDLPGVSDYKDGVKRVHSTVFVEGPRKEDDVVGDLY